MPEKSKSFNLGIVIRVVLAAALLIVGIYNIVSAFTKDDKKDKAESKTSINEFVVDKNDVEFCVTKVEDLKTVGSGYSEVTTENNFVVVTLKIVNGGDEPYDVNSLRFLLTDGEKEYEYDSNTIFSFDNAMTMDTINPGITKEYTIAYETTTTTQDSEFMLKIKPNAYIDEDCVYITLKDAE